MPQGIQIFDEQGNIVLDTTDMTGLIIDKIIIKKGSGVIHHDLFDGVHTIFYIILPESNRNDRPNIVIENNRKILKL